MYRPVALVLWLALSSVLAMFDTSGVRGRQATSTVPVATPAAAVPPASTLMSDPDFANCEEPCFIAAEEIAAVLREKQRVWLKSVHVDGELNLENMTIEVFKAEDTVFKGDVNASYIRGEAGGGSYGNRGWLDPDRFPRAYFTLSGVTFEGRAYFNWSLFDAFNCERCVFKDQAIFENMNVFDEVYLNGSKFEDDVMLNRALIRGWLVLYNAQFEQTVDLTGADLHAISTYLMTTNDPIKISWSQFGPATLKGDVDWALARGTQREQRNGLEEVYSRLLFWMQNFEDLGQQRDVLAVKRELVRFREDYFDRHCQWAWGNPCQKDWWKDKVTGVAWNEHGTAPFRPVFILFGMIGAFGLFYWGANAFEEEEEGKARPMGNRLLFSLLYSIDTFVPLKIVTGVKEDWGWKVRNEFRYVELSEAVIGAVVTVLPAYSVSAYLL